MQNLREVIGAYRTRLLRETDDHKRQQLLQVVIVATLPSN